DALRMNMMISYQELVRTFPNIFNMFNVIFKTYFEVFHASSMQSENLLLNQSKSQSRIGFIQANPPQGLSYASESISELLTCMELRDIVR
ncbi:hypothetical protein E0K92_14890, partial [Escherichia coli]